MDEETLEKTITALVKRKAAMTEGSSEHAMLERQLTGLRYSYKDAGGIIEDLDPDWFMYCEPL